MPRLAPRRLAARSVLALLASAGLASLANADLPAILDRAPQGATAILAAPSLDKLDTGAARIMGAMGQAPNGLKAAMEMLGLAQTVDMTRPVAILMMPVADPNAAAEAPPIIALLPVNDFQAMAKALGATDAGAAMPEISLQGETFYAKSVEGNYAALSPLKSILEKYDGAGGNLAAHAAALGQAGERVASKGDVFIMFDPEAVQQMSKAGLNPLAGALQKPLMAAGLGGAMQQGGIPGAQLMQDAVGGVLAIRNVPAGMHLELAMNYKPGSERAAMLEAGGASTSLLRSLPDEPFLIAYAADLSTPGMKNLIKAIGGNDPAAAASQPLLALGAAVEGQAVAIYPNPAGVFGGLLARSVSFYAAKDPSHFTQSFKTLITGLNGQVADNAQISTTYTDGALNEGALKADAYSLKMLSTGGGGSPLALFYGPSSGPNGHVASNDKGVYVTTVADAKLMSKALATVPDSSLASNKVVSQVASNLPANRSGELYVGVKPILDTILPFMAMAGINANFTPPADMPPVGIAFVPEGGGFAVDAFVPTEVMTAMQSLGSAIQQAAPQGGAGQPKKPAF